MSVRKLRLITLSLVAVLAATLAAPAALAQTQSLYWERFDVDITVQADGSLRVVETQVINFTSGTFTEGFAEIPTARTDGIIDVTVSEGGRDYRGRSSSCCLSEGEYAVEEESGSVFVTWNMGRTRNETRTFVIAYTVLGTIRRYTEGNEFQWNAVAPELHDFDIRAARVTVSMPAGVPISYADYLVPPEFSGVPMTVDLSANGEVATWEAQRSLSPSQGIQVVVQFPPNTVGGPHPSWQAEFDRQNAWEQGLKPVVDLGLIVLGVLILLGGPALLYAWWYLRGRDPNIDAVPEYITQPPADVPPGIAGTLVDERADVADVLATLMDLARRGYLVIEESSESNAFRLVSKQFTLKKAEGAPDLGLLNPFERQLYDDLFKGRDAVSFQQLNQRFYANMGKLQRQLYITAVNLGLFSANPETVRGSYGCLGKFVLGAVLLAGFCVVPMFLELTSTLICPVVALAAVGVGLLIVGPHMPVKTRKGAEAAALSRAFKTYLANLEKYADPKQVTEQFEKYLPYAIAFGLEKTWINRFSRIPETPMPGWYFPTGRPYMGRIGQPSTPGTVGTLGQGAGQGQPAGAPLQMPTLQGMSDSLSGGLQGMSDGLSSMLNSASRTLTSTPPPSNTSGGGRSYTGSSSSGRSFSGGSRGGGGSFRSSGGGGGGRRGFR
jgi:uncharacterized membrane protein YgcG